MTTVKETDRAFVKAYVQDYADAITENYRLYHIDSMEHMLRRDPESVYAAQELNDVQTGKANLMKFVVKTGKKYYKIVQQELALATLNYLDLCAVADHVNWGDGDSLDRERVRDFVLQRRATEQTATSLGF